MIPIDPQMLLKTLARAILEDAQAKSPNIGNPTTRTPNVVRLPVAQTWILNYLKIPTLRTDEELRLFAERNTRTPFVYFENNEGRSPKPLSESLPHSSFQTLIIPIHD